MTTFTISDLATRAPDWDRILVASDYFEDIGDLRTANAFRWLHTYLTWPDPTNQINCRWYFTNASYTTSNVHRLRKYYTNNNPILPLLSYRRNNFNSMVFKTVEKSLNYFIRVSHHYLKAYPL